MNGFFRFSDLADFPPGAGKHFWESVFDFGFLRKSDPDRQFRTVFNHSDEMKAGIVFNWKF